MSDKACKGCFLECEPYEMVPPKSSNPYPCNNDTRAWAEEHRHDPGNSRGFIWEATDDRR